MLRKLAIGASVGALVAVAIVAIAALLFGLLFLFGVFEAPPNRALNPL